MSDPAARKTSIRGYAARSVSPPRVGRPPRVTTQAIIDAALEIGLEKVSLKQLADHLGLGLATLYRHVRNRTELVRLAAFQLTLSRKLQDDEDAHWSQLAVRYAESLFASFVNEPELISELMRGSLGPHSEVDVLEQFLAAMSRYGFSVTDSLHIHRAVGSLAIGAAAGAIALATGRATGTPWDTAMRRALAERDEEELPFVRSALGEYLRLDSTQWLETLYQLLTGIALSRGEQIPPISVVVPSVAAHRQPHHKTAAASPKTAKPKRRIPT